MEDTHKCSIYFLKTLKQLKIQDNVSISTSFLALGEFKTIEYALFLHKTLQSVIFVALSIFLFFFRLKKNNAILSND